MTDDDRSLAKRAARAPMLDTMLAYLYAPLQPLKERVTLRRESGRGHDPDRILVPDGYAVEVVAADLTTPVDCCFDDDGACYVFECGYKVETGPPRILKVDVATGRTETFFRWPEERWKKTGAVTGGFWHDGWLYVNNSDTLSRISPDGTIEDLVTDLPGLGDHQANHPVLGPDGRIYWGQGTVTNAGVVGADNFSYEWLSHFPEAHDRPAADVTLIGRNFAFQDVLGSLTDTVHSGAYVPFGTPTEPGQLIPGSDKPSGAILRCDPDGGDLEVVAWGLRNPYGLAFHPDGRLFATEHGIDERGARYIVGDLEDLYEITEGAWYGWPDYASGIPLDDPRWGDGGRGREPVLQAPPDPQPPGPFVTFPPHSAPNGLDFCRDPSFGFEGDAFVTLFGDVSPITARRAGPVGFKVVRVDVDRREVVDFAVNRVVGPNSKVHHRGFERPSNCTFGPDGALYVTDWGVISIALEKGGVRMKAGTGTLWRIRRTSETIGLAPREPVQLPVYAAKVTLAVAVLMAVIIALIVLL